MDFTLSGESQMMVKAARDFAEQVIEPIVAKIEEEDALPDDLLEKFANGYCKDYGIERLYRTIAHAGVTASSTELQKTIVGSALGR